MARTGEDPTLANLMNDIGLAVRGLEPADPLHRAIASACVGDYADVLKSRWAVIEGLHGAIATPFYWVLVFWLAIMFGCFGLRAPPNRLNLIVIVMCAISVEHRRSSSSTVSTFPTAACSACRANRCATR